LQETVNNHVKIHQSAIQKYTTLETAKIQKACYKSLLYHEGLKMVYFSVAMAVYFWMAIYNLLDKAQNNVKFIEQVSRIFGVCCKTIFRETISAKIKSVFLQQKRNRVL